MVMEIYKKFIISIGGYSIVGTVGNGVQTIRFLEKNEFPVNLLILDIFMPELDGIQTLRKIREIKKNVDVVVVSAANEASVIKEAIRYGVLDFIAKPFTYERFKNSLESFRSYFHMMESNILSQEEIAFAFSRGIERRGNRLLPKGLSFINLEKVISTLKENGSSLSAEEIAEIVGISRVTARRYLEYLTISGRAIIEPFYKGIGRPINKYKLIY